MSFVQHSKGIAPPPPVKGTNSHLGSPPLDMSMTSAEPCLPPSRVAAVSVKDHVVFELLFEGLVQRIGTVQNSLELLKTDVQHAESFHALRLSTNRNHLLTVSVCFSIISMCTSIGSFVGSLFGMNLTNGLETSKGTFELVSLTTTAGVVLGSLVLFGRLAWTGVLANSE